MYSCLEESIFTDYTFAINVLMMAQLLTLRRNIFGEQCSYLLASLNILVRNGSVCGHGDKYSLASV